MPYNFQTGSSIKVFQPPFCMGYGHVQRMEEGRLPKQAMKWNPPGRRKRGRPKLTWAEGIRGLMGEKGLVEEDWNDRDEWRKKILQVPPNKCMHTLTK